MDRALLKEQAKEIMKKNHWLCVGVAFLGALTLGNSSGNIKIEIPQTQNIAEMENVLKEMFADFLTPDFLIKTVVFGMISLFISILLKVLVTNQFFVGSCRFFLKFRQNHPVTVSEIFQSYKDKTFLNVAKVTFLRDLFVYLWGLLFIIPGIIKSLEYFAVDYILAVRPDADSDEVFDLSKRMMKGNKLALFELGFSFIGWFFLSIFACGLPFFLYVTPYIRIAQTLFFCEIREDAIRRGIITESDVPDYECISDEQPFFDGYYPQYYSNNPQNYPSNTQYSQPKPPPFSGSYPPPNMQPPVQPITTDNTTTEEEQASDNQGDEVE